MRKIEQRLADLKARQESSKYTLCPRCGRDTMKPKLYTNAMSRRVDIQVCDACGVSEAKLDFMQNPESLYTWAAFQPNKPEGDFKEMPAEKAMIRIVAEQYDTLEELFLRTEVGEDGADVRFDAFETLPGLTELWANPFMAKYDAKDGAVSVRIRRNTDGNIQYAADVIGK